MGPSAVDALGALVMIAGWLVFLRVVWRRRQVVRQRARSPYLELAVFVLGLWLGLLLASVGADFSYWWVIGAALLALVQLAAAYLARSVP